MFCTRCGAEQPESARFCERCGHRLELDDPTSVAAAAADPAPPSPSPSPKRSKPDRRLIGAAVALTLVAAVAAVLALTGAFGSGEGADRVAAPAATTAPPAAPATTTTQAPETTPETATTDTGAATPPAQPARATVKRTCGRNGVGGDCHLSVRARPSTAAREVKRLDEGDALRLSCQVRGDSVFSSALGGSSTVWSKTTDGGYVSNAYVAGPRLSARRVTLRSC
jgi:hypothetical protein